MELLSQAVRLLTAHETDTLLSCVMFARQREESHWSCNPDLAVARSGCWSRHQFFPCIRNQCRVRRDCMNKTANQRKNSSPGLESEPRVCKMFLLPELLVPCDIYVHSLPVHKQTYRFKSAKRQESPHWLRLTHLQKGHHLWCDR